MTIIESPLLVAPPLAQEVEVRSVGNRITCTGITPFVDIIFQTDRAGHSYHISQALIDRTIVAIEGLKNMIAEQAREINALLKGKLQNPSRNDPTFKFSIKETRPVEVHPPKAPLMPMPWGLPAITSRFSIEHQYCYEIDDETMQQSRKNLTQSALRSHQEQLDGVAATITDLEEEDNSIKCSARIFYASQKEAKQGLEKTFAPHFYLWSAFGLTQASEGGFSTFRAETLNSFSGDELLRLSLTKLSKSTLLDRLNGSELLQILNRLKSREESTKYFLYESILTISRDLRVKYDELKKEHRKNSFRTQSEKEIDEKYDAELKARLKSEPSFSILSSMPKGQILNLMFKEILTRIHLEDQLPIEVLLERITGEGLFKVLSKELEEASQKLEQKVKLSSLYPIPSPFRFLDSLQKSFCELPSLGPLPFTEEEAKKTQKIWGDIQNRNIHSEELPFLEGFIRDLKNLSYTDPITTEQIDGLIQSLNEMKIFYENYLSFENAKESLEKLKKIKTDSAPRLLKSKLLSAHQNSVLLSKDTILKHVKTLGKNGDEKIFYKASTPPDNIPTLVVQFKVKKEAPDLEERAKEHLLITIGQISPAILSSQIENLRLELSKLEASQAKRRIKGIRGDTPSSARGRKGPRRRGPLS